jgi:methyl-accepting chemotaxis protein
VKLGNLSIRSVLGLIIGLLGVLLVGQLAAGVLGSVERNAAAARVDRLANTSQQLFAALLGFRIERGTFLANLAADGAADASIDQRIVTYRQKSEEGYKAALDLLAGAGESGFAAKLSALTSAHQALERLRPVGERMLHQPKAERDAHATDEFRKVAQDYLDSIVVLSSEIEQSLKLVDPVVDHLLSVKQSAWAARNYGGLVAIRLENASTSGRSWTQAEITGAAEDGGRATQAWSQIFDAASRPDTPASIVDAVARSKQSDAVAMAEQQKDYIKAVSNNQTINVKFTDLATLNTAVLSRSVDVANAALTEMVARAQRQMNAAKWGLVIDAGMMLVATAITAFGFILVRRRVSAPIRTLTEAMRRLAHRDYAVDLVGAERGDEIGEMSRAVAFFRENMMEGDRLAGEKEAEQRRKEQRQVEVDSLIRKFDQTVTQSLQTLTQASGELNTTAGSMSSTAEQGRTKSVIVANVSQEASANVSTVAAATEELSASISEISRQVAESSSIAGTAAAQAARTNTDVQALSDAAQRIGDVVELISGIAEQTNLLALNATIEAARAGEAGKGFAVVAAEVKNLASQTAKATEDITGQVAAIQSATASSVQAIQAIGGTIERVNQIATAIAAAVEEQSAATREIARNVQQASEGTTQVSRHVAGVSEAAAATGAAAGEVLDSAKMLARLSDDLRSDVDRFVGSLRTA